MAYLTIKVTGIDAMVAKIKAIDAATRQKEMTAVARVGATIVLNDARSRVSRDSGDLAADIEIRDRKTALLHEGLVQVGPGQKTAWRAKFVEDGTSPHLIKKKRKKVLADAATQTFFGPAVKHRGARAKPFMRPALENNRDRVFQAMRDAMERLIVKAVR